jgi:hypothetical protein
MMAAGQRTDAAALWKTSGKLTKQLQATLITEIHVMATHPMGPRLLKGAVVGFDLFNPIASVIVFQYNPETVTRTLKARGATGEGSLAEPTRINGAPEETIKVDVEIDATDQLEEGETGARNLGVYPQLSALEILLYPKSAAVVRNSFLLASGTIEVLAPASTFTLFVWGKKRILPVQLTDFSITEEAHDASLNPIRAKLSLGLRVLTYNDLPLSHPGYALFLAHQIAKEAMAVAGSFDHVTAVAGKLAAIPTGKVPDIAGLFPLPI